MLCSPNDIMDYSKSHSTVIVNAMHDILWNFYYKSASTITIRMRSNPTIHTEFKVDELVGQLINNESEIHFLTYIIENTTKVLHQDYRRYFNLFVVDNYESFRYSKTKFFNNGKKNILICWKF